MKTTDDHRSFGYEYVLLQGNHDIVRGVGTNEVLKHFYA